jgi:hypothetical protein
MRVSLNSVAENWAAAVALWALPYLTLLGYLRPEAAQSDVLQWSLLLVGILGFTSVICAAWQDTMDPAWRASRGLPPRAQPSSPAARAMPSNVRNAAST